MNVLSLNITLLFSDLEIIFSKSPPLELTNFEKLRSFAFESILPYIASKSATEFTLDSIYHNRYSRMVGMAKDISAGAVMFATIISVLVGSFLKKRLC